MPRRHVTRAGLLLGGFLTALAYLKSPWAPAGWGDLPSRPASATCTRRSGRASSHLLDPVTGAYNLPDIARVFGNKPSVRVVHLVVREQGLHRPAAADDVAEIVPLAAGKDRRQHLLRLVGAATGDDGIHVVLDHVGDLQAVGDEADDRADRTDADAGFKSITVLGDSLSDTGRLFRVTGIPPAPYYQGRMSNGPLWVEHLAPRVGLRYEPLDNFAWAGATTVLVTRSAGGIARFSSRATRSTCTCCARRALSTCFCLSSARPVWAAMPSSAPRRAGP